MKEPWILGIASSHNGGAALLRGDQIVVAVQEERLLRLKRAKHPGAYPSLAVQYCLDTACIRAADLQAISLCRLETVLVPDEDLLANPQLDAARPGVALFAAPHHLAHAVAVYALSGKEESSVLVVDGSGSFWSDLPVAERDAVPEAQRARALRHASAGWQPRECASIYSIRRGGFTPVEKHISLGSTTFHSVGMAPFASLGNMYGAVGLQIFGDFLDGPGKVMRLAPYGHATIPVEEFFRVTEWGFEFQSAAIARFQHRDRWPQRQAEYRDLAASVQKAGYRLGLRSRRHRGSECGVQNR
jgi:carbamoyltransferase